MGLRFEALRDLFSGRGDGGAHTVTVGGPAVALLRKAGNGGVHFGGFGGFFRERGGVGL